MASRVVRARLDHLSAQGLALLMGEGRNESEAVREALAEAGARRRRRSSLSAEVAALAVNASDSAERAAVLAEMESIGSDWPE